MMYWLTALDLFSVITDQEPQPGEFFPGDMPYADFYQTRNFNCVGRILSMLSDNSMISTCIIPLLVYCGKL